MAILKAIELYKLSGRPPFKDGQFSASIAATSEAISLINSLLTTQGNGEFTNLLADGASLDAACEETVPTNTRQIEFSFMPPANSGERFYKSIEDFISRSSISKGDIPSNYCVPEINYCSSDAETENQKLKTLLSIAQAIRLLAKIAQYHDEKKSDKFYKLIFIASGSTPAALETKITIEMLERQELKLELLNKLCSSEFAQDPHYNTYIGIFTTSVAEFIQNSSSQTAFSRLVLNWEEFLQLYQDNLETFLSGFAFHKTKKQIAETELQLAENFTKVLGDITGKLLLIPVSSVAIIKITNATIPEQTILTLGLVAATLVIIEAIRNQEFHFENAKHAKELIFNSLEGEKNNYPDALKEQLNQVKERFNSKQKSLQWWFWCISILAWAPPAAAIAIISHQNYTTLCTLAGKLLSIIKYFCQQ